MKCDCDHCSNPAAFLITDRNRGSEFSFRFCESCIGDHRKSDENPDRHSMEIATIASKNRIRYRCGTRASVGDLVDFDGDDAIVESVIATKKEIEDWGLQEAGAMFTSLALGRVFQALDSPGWSDIVFVKRAIV